MAGCCRAPVALAAPARLRTRLAWVAAAGALALALAWAVWAAPYPGETLTPALEFALRRLKPASQQRPEKRHAARAELARAHAVLANERLRPWTSEVPATDAEAGQSTGASADIHVAHDAAAAETLGLPAVGGKAAALGSSDGMSGDSSGGRSGGNGGYRSLNNNSLIDGGGGGRGGAAVGQLCAAAGHGKRAVVRAALQRPEVACLAPVTPNLALSPLASPQFYPKP